MIRPIRKSGAVAIIAAALLACGGAYRDKYLAKGNQAYQRGQYAEASINYRKALQSDPNFGEAYYRLGMAEGKLGRTRQSLAALSRAADLMPENEDARALAGQLYLMRYQTDHDAPAYQKVNEICDRLLARNARSFEAFRLKAYQAIADEKPDQALDFFTRANSIRPLVPDVAITLTQTLFLVGRTTEALELGRSLIKAHPDAGPIYDTLYRHYVNAGNLAEAERALIAKIKNNPTDAFPVQQLAEHYWRHNQRAEAGEAIHRLLENPKAFPQAYRLIGEFYQRMGEQDEAVRAFEAGANTHPDEKAAYEQRAIDSLVVAGKRDQALERINGVLAAGVAGRTADELKSTRAGLLLRSPLESDHALAVHDLEALVRKAPYHASWHFQLGQAYAAGRDLGVSQYNQSRHELETVVRLDPSHTQAWLALADLALRALNFEDSRRYAEQALTHDPSLSKARLVRARALVGLGQFDEARGEYDKLVRANPSDRQVLLQYALLEVAEGRHAAAEKIFRANYDPAHGDFRALEGLTAMYFSEGQPEKAFALLETQATVYPNSTELARIHAVAAGRAGQWDRAIREYERLRPQQPEDAGILLALGDAYQHAGDFARAIPLLERAQTLRATDWRAPFLLGYAYQALDKPVEAEAAYRQCLRLNPDYPEALNNFSFLLAENDRVEQAAALAQQAVRTSGGTIASSDTLGLIYFKQNRTESARQLFSTLLARDPHNPMLHYHFGLVLRQKGDCAQGDREIVTAIQTGLPRAEQQAARQLLSRE